MGFGTVKILALHQIQKNMKGKYSVPIQTLKESEQIS